MAQMEMQLVRGNGTLAKEETTPGFVLDKIEGENYTLKHTEEVSSAEGPKLNEDTAVVDQEENQEIYPETLEEKISKWCMLFGLIFMVCFAAGFITYWYKINSKYW